MALAQNAKKDAKRYKDERNATQQKPLVVPMQVSKFFKPKSGIGVNKKRSAKPPSLRYYRLESFQGYRKVNSRLETAFLVVDAVYITFANTIPILKKAVECAIGFVKWGRW
jgi:hypothetical protein